MKIALFTTVLAAALSTSVLANTVTLQAVTPKTVSAKPVVPSNTVKQKLAAMHWNLVSIQAPKQKASTTLKSGIPASKYTFTIDNKQGMFYAKGCNGISFGYNVVSASQLKLTPGMSTLMACEPKLMQADQEISEYLKGSVNYQFVGANTLKLTTPTNAVLTLKGTPTAETKYQGEGKIKFVEVVTLKSGSKWRKVSYDKDFIKKTYGNWNKGTVSIEGFKPQSGNRVVVRVKEFNKPQSKAKVWVSDMVTESEILNIK